MWVPHTHIPSYTHSPLHPHIHTHTYIQVSTVKLYHSMVPPLSKVPLRNTPTRSLSVLRDSTRSPISSRCPYGCSWYRVSGVSIGLKKGLSVLNEGFYNPYCSKENYHILSNNFIVNYILLLNNCNTFYYII